MWETVVFYYVTVLLAVSLQTKFCTQMSAHSYSHVYVWLSTGFWIGYWIYWPFIHITRSYKQLPSWSPQFIITTTPAKPFLACCVFTSCVLATSSNSRDPQLPRSSPLWTAAPFQLPLFLRLQYRTDLVVPIFFLITPRHGPRRRPRSSSTSIVACFSIAAGKCLPSHCLETLWYICLSRSRCIVTAVHPTIYSISYSVFLSYILSTVYLCLRHLLNRLPYVREILCVLYDVRYRSLNDLDKLSWATPDYGLLVLTETIGHLTICLGMVPGDEL
jgi:hypothetical protein